jgi:hypothetical protein
MTASPAGRPRPRPAAAHASRCPVGLDASSTIRAGVRVGEPTLPPPPPPPPPARPPCLTESHSRSRHSAAVDDTFTLLSGRHAARHAHRSDRSPCCGDVHGRPGSFSEWVGRGLAAGQSTRPRPPNRRDIGSGDVPGLRRTGTRPFCSLSRRSDSPSARALLSAAVGAADVMGGSADVGGGVGGGVARWRAGRRRFVRPLAGGRPVTAGRHGDAGRTHPLRAAAQLRRPSRRPAPGAAHRRGVMSACRMKWRPRARALERVLSTPSRGTPSAQKPLHSATTSRLNHADHGVTDSRGRWS